jgi:hypothetical protein
MRMYLTKIGIRGMILTMKMEMKLIQGRSQINLKTMKLESGAMMVVLVRIMKMTQKTIIAPIMVLI